MGGERMRKRGDSLFLLQPSVMGEGGLSNRQVGAEEPRSRRAYGIVPGVLRHSSHASRIALPMATQHMDSTWTAHGAALRWQRHLKMHGGGRSSCFSWSVFDGPSCTPRSGTQTSQGTSKSAESGIETKRLKA